MRRTLPFVAVWFAAGALAAAIATAGVAVVDDQLTSSRPPPLSAQQVRDALADGDRAQSSAGTTSTTAAEGSTTSTTAGPSRSAGDDEVGSGDTGGARPVEPTTTTARAPAPSPAAVTRTYDLVGGTATLRFSPTGVTVVAATPAPGFDVGTGDSHDGGTRVEFESDDHRSRLDAWWDGGPQDEVREDD